MAFERERLIGARGTMAGNEAISEAGDGLLRPAGPATGTWIPR